MFGAQIDRFRGPLKTLLPAVPAVADEDDLIGVSHE
jgi:hypothetical protein